VIGADLYARNEPLLRAALAGQPQHFDREIVDASGAVRYAHVSYLPDFADELVVGQGLSTPDPRRAATTPTMTGRGSQRSPDFTRPLGSNGEPRFRAS
jgi:hypothetical protein